MAEPPIRLKGTQGSATQEGGKAGITDKEFYKAMQKLKERGTSAVPPKKSASAYIIFGKEVLMTHLKFFRKEQKYSVVTRWQR